MAKKTKALKSLAQIGAGLGTAYLLSRMEEPKAEKNTAAEIAQDTARVNQYDNINKKTGVNKPGKEVIPPSQIEKNKVAEIAQDKARVNQYTQTRKRSDNVAENFDSFIPRLAIMAEGGEVEIGKGKDYIKDLL